MPVKRILDTDVGSLSIVKAKDNQYIREGSKSLELQTAWLKLGKLICLFLEVLDFLEGGLAGK